MELHEAVTYRMAYGLTDQLREARGYDCQRGRYRSNAAAGGQLEAILAEVLRRLGAGEGGEQGVVREGVEDAMEGRRPRWWVKPNKGT